MTSLTLKNLLLVALGGSLGATFRFLVSVLFAFTGLQGFLATFAVNLLGSFLISLLAFGSLSSNAPLKLFLLTGLLGAFTTMSAFSLEAIVLFKTSGMALGASFVCISVLACLFGCYAGAYFAT